MDFGGARLRRALEKFATTFLQPGARAFDRILKVAHSIDDLPGSVGIAADHVSEAIQFRSLDWQLWT